MTTVQILFHSKNAFPPCFINESSIAKVNVMGREKRRSEVGKNHNLRSAELSLYAVFI